jgi:hypothetical protein
MLSQQSGDQYERREVQPLPSEATLLDVILPVDHFHEVHATTVGAPPAVITAAIRTLKASEVPLFRELMWLRRLPALLLSRLKDGRAWFGGGDAADERVLRLRSGQSLLAEALAGGFVLLGEIPEREIVLGASGTQTCLTGEGASAAKRWGSYSPSVRASATWVRMSSRCSCARRNASAERRRCMGGEALARISLRQVVAARAGHGREYCRAPEAIFNQPLEIDHIVPRARGATDALDHLALACR